MRSGWIYDDMRWGWDDIIRVDFMLRSWDSHSWVFCELFVRIQGVEMSCYEIELYVGSWVW